MRLQIIQLLFRQPSLQEGLIPVFVMSLAALTSSTCLVLGSQLAEGGIVASEERRAPGVTADLLKVTFCPPSSVLKSPFQVLNRTQLKNSIFSQDGVGVSAKGLESYSFNPNLEFVHWSAAGSCHDIVDLVSWIQAQKHCLHPSFFRWLFFLKGEIGRCPSSSVLLHDSHTDLQPREREDVSFCLWFY